MIPEGYYNAKAVPYEGSKYAEFGEASTGTEQVSLGFKISDGEQEGRMLTWFGFFTDAATEYTMKNLQACGFVGYDLDTIDERPLDREVQLCIQHEEYNGKTRARIAFINPIGVMRQKLPMSSGGLRNLAARVKAQMKASGAAVHAPNPHPVKPPVDDDMPF